MVVYVIPALSVFTRDLDIKDQLFSIIGKSFGVWGRHIAAQIWGDKYVEAQSSTGGMLP